MREKAGTALALFLCLIMLLTVLPAAISAEVATDRHVFLEEGAEEATYDEWNARWPRYDANDDPTSGQDFWCRQMHEVHSGQRSIYCARNGINSHYLNGTGHQPWNVNLTSLPESVSQTNYVLRYETNQDAIMHKVITGARYYNNITMTFWFWSDTGRSDAKQPGSGEEVGYDFLNAIYYTGSGEDRVKHVLWTDSYAEATAKTWTQVSVKIPQDATEVGFEFVSGTVAPEGGDAADAFSSLGMRVLNGGMKEGVFLDDISVVGTEPTADVPLATAVDTLPAYEANRSFPVTIVDNDPQVGLKYTYLYYRMAGEVNWTKYTTSDNPDGKFSALPITFDAAQDGTYEFFSAGVDQQNVAEEIRNAADAITIVDSVAPTSEMIVAGDRSGDAYNGMANFTLSASDPGSGIDRISYRIDGSAWMIYEGKFGLAADGPHAIEYFATDKAGNEEEVRSAAISITNGTYSIVFQDENKSYPEKDVTINFTVVAGSAISKMQYSLDKGSFVALDAGARSVSLTGLAEGEHTLTVRATDSEGVIVQGDLTFTVGRGGSSGGGIVADIMAQPLAVLGLVVIAAAAVGGVALWARKKQRR